MSMRFTPLSTAVAIATASLIAAIAGCASSSRSGEETAGLSRDVDTNAPTAGQAMPTNPLENATPTPSSSEMASASTTTTDMASASMPPSTSSETEAAQAGRDMRSDATSTAPATTTAQATTPSAPTYPSTTDYSRSTTDTTSGMNSRSADTSSSGAYNGTDPSPPPRRDRN